MVDTPRLGLVKPAYIDTADIAALNDNSDIIDAAVGVSIVNSVGDISLPYNGQFAYELTFHQLRFFISGEWLLVASGDQNVGNPDRIQLPPGTLNALNDTTNAFQIGDDGVQNLAMDQNTIQSRINHAAAALKLNENGGNVQIGKNIVMTVSENGVRSDAMDPDEAFDGGNIVVGSGGGSFVNGSPEVKLTMKAPPSGKFLVTLSARCNIGNSGLGTISFEVVRVSNGNTLVSAGGSGNSIDSRGQNASDNNITTSVSDLVKGAVAGENYRFQVKYARDAGGTNFAIDFRKILVLPVP